MSEWIKISCKENDALHAHRDLVILSGLTDMDGEHGDPLIFREWGDRDTEQPVLRDYRWPSLHCEHYRFVEVVTSPEEKQQ